MDKWCPKCNKLFKKKGYFVIVVTNQSGVKRKFYSKNDVNKLHNWMNEELKKNYNTYIDDFFLFNRFTKFWYKFR